MTTSTLNRRALAYLNGELGGTRDLNDVLGYPEALDISSFFTAYSRWDIAGRLIDAYPDATWRYMPDISPNGELRDRFWELFGDKQRLLSVFHRLDRLTQLGHYGALHIGLDDGEDPSLPVSESSRPTKILYLRPHSERTCTISRWVTDPKDERYGLPELYQVQVGMGAGTRTQSIHHSRIIHVVEHPLEDSTVGTPRLERVWNRLIDLQKVVGGSAETFWLNAAMLTAFVADSESKWKLTKDELKTELDKLYSGLQRHIRLQGVTPQVLKAAVDNPESHFRIIVSLIAGSEGIPQRILLGSEQAQLASGQDADNWHSRNSERRELYAAPQILVPFMTKLQKWGFLPPGDFDIIWPELEALSVDKQADIATKRTGALFQYVQAQTLGGDLIVSPETFREWLGLEGDDMPSGLEWGDVEDVLAAAKDALGRGEYEEAKAIISRIAL